MTYRIATSFRLTPEVRAWLERHGQALVKQLESDLGLLQGLLQLTEEAKQTGSEWTLPGAINFITKLSGHPGS